MEHRQSRREYQRLLRQRREQMRRKRRTRVRRIRALRAIRTVRFWTRTSFGALVLLVLAFWAKFAFVYDVPNYAQRLNLVGVSAYVAVKPWWFGPPIFNLAEYTAFHGGPEANVSNPYQGMLTQLGPYQAIVIRPDIVWLQRQ